MNFMQSFEEFSRSLGPTDLLLYAGVGIVLWVLFKDQLSPVQKIIMNFINKIKGVQAPSSIVPRVSVEPKATDEPNIFFDLVASWKQTRDLAEKSGCAKAVEVADQMFPYLSPTICGDNNNDTK